ncbi:MAG: SDR family NAD(P)-dependent oxidoreductase [Candidatus Caenarcaniphilales bacterium]|nr:SDR family NAD(P)-dependent oxidoreductase [Candidatus Caenarcaniphilales bacterium]
MLFYLFPLNPPLKSILVVGQKQKTFLKNKKALVSGASGKLGQSICKSLAEEGIHLALHYRSNFSTVKELKDFAEGKKVKALTFQADLSTQNSVEELIGSAQEGLGGIDFLINCVGDFLYKPLLELEVEEFRQIIDSNLTNVFALCKTALPHLRKSACGRIINIGYANATELTAKPSILPYHIAKLGLVLLTKSLAQKEKETAAKKSVLINCISPGICEDSEFWPQMKPLANSLVKKKDLNQLILFLLGSETLTGCNFEIGGDWK